MKHVVVGSGITGKSTGVWLEANNEEVIFNDINADTIKKLKADGHKVATNLKLLKDIDIFWICTAEWHVDNAMASLPPIKNSTIVIRSTIEPGILENLSKKHGTPNIAHVPEFLRASTAISDVFNPDRVVIGTHNDRVFNQLEGLFKNHHVPVIRTLPNTSSLIKLVSNAWLSTQIVFWLEIKRLCDKYRVNPEEVANAVTLDKRISEYGSNSTGKPFSGACLPKDLDTIIRLYKEKNLFEGIKEANK